jgi:hypothetical protein
MAEVAIPWDATSEPALLPMGMWLWFVIAVVLIVALVVRLCLVVRADGLGHRPPPASHHEWFEPLT